MKPIHNATEQQLNCGATKQPKATQSHANIFP